MSNCRSCGARVTWAASRNGRPMIIDEDPVPEGNVVLETTHQGLKATVYGDAAAAEEAHPGEPRYLDHHVTCPQAGDWRGRG